MEPLLVGVTIVSLLLAAVMSAIAWSFARSERQRSAARAEALAALAFSDVAAGPGPLRSAASPAPLYLYDEDTSIEALSQGVDDLPTETDWDASLHDIADADTGRPVLAAPAVTPRARHRVVLLPDAMFEAGPASGASSRRWLAVAVVALVIAGGVAIYKGLHTPGFASTLVAASPSPSPRVDVLNGPHPLELLSLRHQTGADGTFTIMGLVQNPPDGQSLARVDVVVYLFDDDGRYFATGKSELDIPAIAPGDESPFLVKVATPGSVTRYRVGFRSADGRVVAHIDRRGQLPIGTTGDSVDVEPAVATSGAGRVERALAR